jgi:hypothetical protein
VGVYAVIDAESSKKRSNTEEVGQEELIEGIYEDVKSRCDVPLVR